MQANSSLFLIQSRGSQCVSLPPVVPADRTVRGPTTAFSLKGELLLKIERLINFIHPGVLCWTSRYIYTSSSSCLQTLHAKPSLGEIQERFCSCRIYGALKRIHGVYLWYGICPRRGSLSFTQRWVPPVVHFCEQHQRSKRKILNKHCQLAQDAFKLQQWGRDNKKNGDCDSWFIVIAAAVFPPINLWYARVLN